MLGAGQLMLIPQFAWRLLNRSSANFHGSICVPFRRFIRCAFGFASNVVGIARELVAIQTSLLLFLKFFSGLSFLPRLWHRWPLASQQVPAHGSVWMQKK